MVSPNLFNNIFVIPIVNLLVAFYQLFLAIHLPAAFGLSIIALTSFIRLILHPFFDKQMQATKKMQDIKPHLDALSLKHKKDAKKLQAEQMRLYKEAGINPASGCLFVIIQIPVFIGLYNTLSLFFTHGSLTSVITEINKVLYFPFLKIHTIDPYLFGFNLALSPAKAGIWYYYLIPVVTGALQYFQVTSSTPPAPKTVVKDIKKGEETKEVTEDFQKAMQTQMKFIFPIMIGWFSYTLPLGLSLYWNIFSLFSIIQYKRAHQKS
jgi:YidC/Oxa1 family membrane protein insertase